MKYIEVTLRIDREGQYYTSECLELGTASFGETKEEALKNIIEATELYLNTLEEFGECTEVLANKRIDIKEGVPRYLETKGRLSSRMSRVTVDLPLAAACA